jgi:hypothetical protein
MTSPDHNTPRPPLTSGGDDDIIELTEVMDEAPAEGLDDGAAEVVLEFSPGSDLSALKGPSEPPAESAVPSPAPPEESLDDFLAALPELSEDLDIPAKPAPPPTPPTPATQDLRQELAERLSDEDLREVVRQVVQETVERLAREVFPDMAAQAIDRELARWKKRLSDPD